LIDIVFLFILFALPYFMAKVKLSNDEIISPPFGAKG